MWIRRAFLKVVKAAALPRGRRDAFTFGSVVLRKTYSRSDFGSDKFFGDCLFNTAIDVRPEGVHAYFPLAHDFFGAQFAPVEIFNGSSIGSSVEPSSEIPANNPRDRE